MLARDTREIMSNASKGKAWERHFVNTLDDLLLPAYRVPGSGSRRGYVSDGNRKEVAPDDVVVADEWRVECKYRTKGGGFSRLWDWLEDAGIHVIILPESALVVMRIELWVDLCQWRLAEDNRCLSIHDYEDCGMLTTYWNNSQMFHNGPIPKKHVKPQETLLGWLGTSDALAVKKSNQGGKGTFPWLVLERVSPEEV